ncbi:hypothetical protein Tco_0065105 [Tanacetum coccineum]
MKARPQTKPVHLCKAQLDQSLCTAGISSSPPSHVVHAGPNLEHMDLETTDASLMKARYLDFRGCFSRLKLPGLPRLEEIEFGIELIPGAESISRLRIAMAPVE